MLRPPEPARTFSVQVRVYYEDVDIGGVLYYANYLRYFERASSEWLRSHGVNHCVRHSDMRPQPLPEALLARIAA